MAKRVRYLPGRRVTARYGDRDTSGVITGVRAGRYAVDLDIPGADEPVHALLREDELSPA